MLKTADDVLNAVQDHFNSQGASLEGGALCKWAEGKGLDVQEAEAAVCLLAFKHAMQPPVVKEAQKKPKADSKGDKPIDSDRCEPCAPCAPGAYEPKPKKDKKTGDMPIEKKGSFSRSFGEAMTKEAEGETVKFKLGEQEYTVPTSVLYGGAGAAGGGILGYLLSDENKLKNAILGALTGGATVGGAHHFLSKEPPPKPKPKPKLPHGPYATGPENEGLESKHSLGMYGAPAAGAAIGLINATKPMFGTDRRLTRAQAWERQKKTRPEVIRRLVPKILLAQGLEGGAASSIAGLGIPAVDGEIPGTMGAYKKAPQLQKDLKKAVNKHFKPGMYTSALRSRPVQWLKRPNSWKSRGARTGIGGLLGLALSQGVDYLTSQGERQ